MISCLIGSKQSNIQHIVVGYSSIPEIAFTGLLDGNSKLSHHSDNLDDYYSRSPKELLLQYIHYGSNHLVSLWFRRPISRLLRIWALLLGLMVSNHKSLRYLAVETDPSLRAPQPTDGTNLQTLTDLSDAFGISVRLPVLENLETAIISAGSWILSLYPLVTSVIDIKRLRDLRLYNSPDTPTGLLPHLVEKGVTLTHFFVDSSCSKDDLDAFLIAIPAILKTLHISQSGDNAGYPAEGGINKHGDTLRRLYLVAKDQGGDYIPLEWDITEASPTPEATWMNTIYNLCLTELACVLDRNVLDNLTDDAVFKPCTHYYQLKISTKD